jgi:hypothetical protein
MNHVASSLPPDAKQLVQRTRQTAAELREEAERARRLIQQAQLLLATSRPWNPLED